MRTSYRDIFLLACCQALLLVNNSALIAMNGLVGYALAPSKSLATLGVTSFVLGSAVELREPRPRSARRHLHRLRRHLPRRLDLRRRGELAE